MLIFMKIHSLGAELLHADGQRDTRDVANTRFSQFAKYPENHVQGFFM